MNEFETLKRPLRRQELSDENAETHREQAEKTASLAIRKCAHPGPSQP